MKAIKFSFLLSLILSLAFTSCSKDEGGKNTKPSTKDFFTIEDATFKTGNLPQGSANFINDLTINNTVINGGSTIVSFSSPEKLKTAFVSVKGVDGYFQYDFPEEQEPNNANPAGAFRTQSDIDIMYYYQLILQIAQQLKEQGFAISISCLTANGNQSAAEDTDGINVVEVGTGKLQISLSWDQLDDVDLHLLEPNGNHIYYGNTYTAGSWEENERAEFEFDCYVVNKYTSHDASSLNYDNDDDHYILWEYLDDVPSSDYYREYTVFIAEKAKQGGFLDLDSNAACDIDEINNENITYANDPAQGVYYVAVDLWSKCNESTPGAKYSVTVNYKGQPVKISDKQAGQFDANNEGSRDRSSQYHIIGGFEITASGIKVVEVTGNPFNYYDDYNYAKSRAANAKTKFFKSKK